MLAKVGDTVYFERFSKLSSKQKIVKITPSGMVKTDGGYNLRGDDNYLRVLGQDKWAVLGARLATPELDKKWREQYAKQWLANNHHLIAVEDIEPLMEKYNEAN